MSVHSSASSRVMRSSSLQPQQDTITSLVITWPLSIGWIISLVLSLITGNSIAQSPQKSTLNFTFFCFFLSPYCDPVSAARGPRKRRFLSTLFYSHSQHCQRLMSSHSRASPIVMVASLPHPQQVTARFSSFNQGSTLSTDISPPLSALLRIPSLIALALSLITVYIVSHFTQKVKLYF